MTSFPLLQELQKHFYYRLCVLGERASFPTGNSRVHYLKSDYYVIQLIAFQRGTACIRSSPDLPSFQSGLDLVWISGFQLDSCQQCTNFFS